MITIIYFKIDCATQLLHPSIRRALIQIDPSSFYSLPSGELPKSNDKVEPKIESAIANISTKLNGIQTDLRIILNKFDNLALNESVTALKESFIHEMNAILPQKMESIEEKKTIPSKDIPNSITTHFPKEFVWSAFYPICKHYYFIKGRCCSDPLIGLLNSMYPGTSHAGKVKTYFCTLRTEWKSKIYEKSKIIENLEEIDVPEEILNLGIRGKGFRFRENEDLIMKEIYFQSTIITAEMKLVVHVCLGLVEKDTIEFGLALKKLDAITERIPDSLLYSNFLSKRK